MPSVSDGVLPNDALVFNQSKRVLPPPLPSIHLVLFSFACYCCGAFLPAGAAGPSQPGPDLNCSVGEFFREEKPLGQTQTSSSVERC